MTRTATRTFSSLAAALLALALAVSLQVPGARAEQATFTVSNLTDGPVDVFWVSGTQQWIGRLAPGETQPITASDGQEFRMKSGDRELVGYTAHGKADTIVLRQFAAQIVPPKEPLDLHGVSGTTVQLVDYGTGAFVQAGPKLWYQVDTDGEGIYRYEGGARDQNRATLVDMDRGVLFTLNLAEGRITALTPGGVVEDFADIERVSDTALDFGRAIKNPPVRRPGDPVTGLNLRMVQFDGIAFVQTNPITWVQVDKASGQVTATYLEVRRGSDLLNLKDKQSGMVVTLALGNIQGIVNKPDGSHDVLDMRGISAESRIPGIDKAWDQP